MTWLCTTSDSLAPLEQVLSLRPRLLERYREMYGQLWDRTLVPPRLLELCRLRIAGVHDCAAERAIEHASAGLSPEERHAVDRWEDSAAFSACDRAVLAFAEKMPWRQHDVTDDDIRELRKHLSEPEVVALAIAAGLFDAHCRLRLTLGLDVRPLRVDAPGSARGPVY
jgi:alkylhydroperoxidase family enzyme